MVVGFSNFAVLRYSMDPNLDLDFIRGYGVELNPNLKNGFKFSKGVTRRVTRVTGKERTHYK